MVRANHRTLGVRGVDARVGFRVRRIGAAWAMWLGLLGLGADRWSCTLVAAMVVCRRRRRDAVAVARAGRRRRRVGGARRRRGHARTAYCGGAMGRRRRGG